MKNLKSSLPDLEEIAAYIATGIVKHIRIPGHSILSFDKLDRWYETNGRYKFQEGDVIKLKRRNIYGCGVNPVGKVLGYTMEENASGLQEGLYIIEMERCENGNFFEWMKTGELPENAEIIRREERHFKINIESHFRKVA